MLGVVLPKEDDRFHVWPCCWDAVTVFLDCSTQWRAGPSGLLGLDYVAVQTVLGWLSIEADKARLFRDLQVMEQEALNAFREGRD